MKIMPIIKSVQQDIKTTSQRISRAGKQGRSIGARVSQIYNSGDILTFVNVSRGVTRKIAKETTIDDLPIIAGAVGFLVPIPLASPIMLGLGIVAQAAVKAIRKAKINKA